jgi:hypothetical protein
MKTEQSNVFLNKIHSKIKKGDYDSSLTIPFMTKELLYASIKSRISKKVETGGTPVLTDAEIKDAIKDTKEVALITAALFVKHGVLVKGVDGYELSDKGKKIIE